MNNGIRHINSLTAIFLLSPFILYFLLMLMPVSDDWTYYTKPIFDAFPTGFIPEGSYWRPFDAAFGKLLSLQPAWFPALNHVCVYAGHLGCCVLIYHIALRLGFTHSAANVTTLYFFISPAVLGTVLGIDSLNQVYSQFWGLAAVYAYLRKKSLGPSILNEPLFCLWPLLVFMAALSKENGLAWSIVPPVLAYGFNLEKRKTALRSLMVGLLIVVAYGCIRLSLPSENVMVEEDYKFTVVNKIKDIATFFGTNFLALDFISLVYKPERNLLAFAITLAASTPLLYIVAHSLWRCTCRDKGHANMHCVASLMACVMIVAAPHLLTRFGTMHSYAPLGMTSLMVGYAAMKATRRRGFIIALSLFVATAVCVDLHHWWKSYQSGITGERMAKEAIDKTGRQVDSVYCIIIEDDMSKFSSFCTIPHEAFGWGIASLKQTGFTWPKKITNSDIFSQYDTDTVRSLATRAFCEGYDCVWVVRKDHLDVVWPKSCWHSVR